MGSLVALMNHDTAELRHLPQEWHETVEVARPAHHDLIGSLWDGSFAKDLGLLVPVNAMRFQGVAEITAIYTEHTMKGRIIFL